MRFKFLVLLVLCMVSVLSVPDGDACSSGADCDNLICVDSDGGFYPGNGVDVCNSSGLLSCGVLCDYNNSAAVEVIGPSGSCDRRDDSCLIDYFYFSSSSTTTELDLYANVSCQCGEIALCNITLTNSSGGVSVYGCDSGELFSGFTIYNPPVGSGTNLVKLNCSCSITDSECESYSLNNATVLADVTSVDSTSPVSPSFRVNSSISLRSQGFLGLRGFVEDFVFSSDYCSPLSQYSWYDAGLVNLSAAGEEGDFGEFLTSYDIGCGDVNEQYVHLVRVKELGSVEDSFKPFLGLDSFSSLNESGVMVQNWSMPGYEGVVDEVRVFFGGLNGGGCEPALKFWVCTNYSATPYACLSSAVAWGELLNDSVVPNGWNNVTFDFKNASFSFSPGQRLGLMVLGGRSCNSTDSWDVGLDSAPLAGPAYWVSGGREDSNSSWSAHSSDVGLVAGLSVSRFDSSLIEGNYSGGCFTVRECYDYASPFIDPRVQCAVCGSAERKVTDYSCVSNSHCCLGGEKFQNGVCCAEGNTCCASDADCGSGEYCDLSINSCVSKGTSGVSCLGDDDCISGHCDNGYCCQSSSQVSGACEDSGGVCRCCRSGSDCSSGYYCDSYANQCIECSVSEDGLCSGAPSVNCVGFDPDCCSGDGDCASSEYCDVNSLVCRACSTKREQWCPSSRCVGVDPDCCDELNPCSFGECNPVTSTCEIRLGNMCEVGADCVSGYCMHGKCTLRDFLGLRPSAFRVRVNERAYVTATVLNYWGEPVDVLLSVDSPIGLFVNRRKSMRVSLGAGEDRSVPVIVESSLPGSFVVEVTAMDASFSDVVSVESSEVVVSGEGAGQRMVTAPEGLNVWLLVLVYGVGVWKVFGEEG